MYKNFRSQNTSLCGSSVMDTFGNSNLIKAVPRHPWNILYIQSIYSLQVHGISFFFPWTSSSFLSFIIFGLWICKLDPIIRFFFFESKKGTLILWSRVPLMIISQKTYYEKPKLLWTVIFQVYNNNWLDLRQNGKIFWQATI